MNDKKDRENFDRRNGRRSRRRSPNPGQPYPRSSGVLTRAADSLLQRNLLKVSLSRIVRGAISVLCLLTVVLTGILISTSAASLSVIMILALVSCVVWTLGYFTLPTLTQASTPKALAAPAQAVPQVSRAELLSAEWYNNRGLFLRYGVSAVALGFGVLYLALLLQMHGYLDEFVVIGPLVLFFPFSYLAYSTFQRQIRVERLKRDFELLGAVWDDNLARMALGFSNFALHIVLVVLVTLVGLTLIYWPNNPVGADGFVQGINLPITPEKLQVMRYGFMGGYLLAAYLIYRRYTTYDLQPPVYLYSAIVMLSGIAFNYVASEALPVPTEGDTLGNGMLAVLSFALGFLPILALRWLTKIAYSGFQIRERRSESLPLSLIDGISELHETRLRDHGIDDVQNLASADIPFLLINTTFSVQTVIDWVDQAILISHLAFELVGEREARLFRQSRVRTMTDFRDMWRPLYIPPPRRSQNEDSRTWFEQQSGVLNDLRAEKARQFTISYREGGEDKEMSLTPEQLDLLYEATNQGPNVDYVQYYWFMTKRKRRQTYLIDSGVILNPVYNQTLQNLFADAHVDQSEGGNPLKWLAPLRELEHKTRNNLTPTNDLATAGLGYSIWKDTHSPRSDSERLIAASECYIDALRNRVDLEDWINLDLKAIGDELLTLAKGQLRQAEILTNIEVKRRCLEQILVLMEHAVFITEYWDWRHGDQPHPCYLYWQAKVEHLLGCDQAALATLQAARRGAEKPLRLNVPCEQFMRDIEALENEIKRASVSTAA